MVTKKTDTAGTQQDMGLQADAENPLQPVEAAQSLPVPEPAADPVSQAAQPSPAPVDDTAQPDENEQPDSEVQFLQTMSKIAGVLTGIMGRVDSFGTRLGAIETAILNLPAPAAAPPTVDLPTVITDIASDVKDALKIAQEIKSHTQNTQQQVETSGNVIHTAAGVISQVAGDISPLVNLIKALKG